MSLSNDDHHLIEFLRERAPQSEALLRQLVETSSATQFRDGVDRVGDLLADRLRALGMRISEVVTSRFGRTVIARTRGDGPRVLLLGHLDTVHSAESPFQGLAADAHDDDRLRGPGAADMKGGLVVLLSALEALDRLGRLACRPLTVVLTSDEEVGSPTSSDIVRGEARDARLCLGFEPGRPDIDGGSTFVTRRKGFGRIELVALGKAAHAGVDPGAGASAILECAHKVIALESLNDPASGRTVTVGVLRGGETANTVPERAEMFVDYRYEDPEDAEDVDDEVLTVLQRHELKTLDGRSRVGKTVRDHVKRPPMVPDQAALLWAARAVEVGADLELKLRPEARGGSSDAATAASEGCPTLCGLGAVGDGFHTDQEWVSRRSLTERAALAAILLDRFFSPAS